MNALVVLCGFVCFGLPLAAVLSVIEYLYV